MSEQNKEPSQCTIHSQSGKIAKRLCPVRPCFLSFIDDFAEMDT